MQKEKLTKKEWAVAREASRRIGKAYCIAWQTAGGRVGQPCKTCPLSKRGKDCKNNAVGYRDYIMSAEYARALEALRASHVTQLELPAGGKKK